jgi:hypothetical protein
VTETTLLNNKSSEIKQDPLKALAAKHENSLTVNRYGMTFSISYRFLLENQSNLALNICLNPIIFLFQK